MGRGNGTLFSVILATLIQLAPVQAQLGSDIIKGITLPEYNKDGKLEYVLYGEQARPNGIKIDIDGLTIDMVIDNLVKATGLNDTRNVQIYSIDEALKDITVVDSFWKTHTKSKGFIKTPKAQYDRSSRFTRGDGIVNLRTLEMDVDGIGFDIDQTNKTAFIRSDVKILIRSNGSNQFGNAKQNDEPKRQSTVITSDTAEVLSAKNLIILEGDVFVENPDITIKCERLVITSEAEKDPETKKRSIKKIECFSSTSDIASILSGQLEQVVITRKDPTKKKNELQRSFSGKAVYTLADGLITLTKEPKIVENSDTIEGSIISLWRDSEKMNVIDSRVTYLDAKDQETVITSKMMDALNKENLLTFTGDVVAFSPDYRITGDKVNVHLEEKKIDNETKREVSYIECFGTKSTDRFQRDARVSITRLDETGLIPEKNVQRSTSGKAVYTPSSGELVLTDKPVIKQGTDKINGSKIIMWRDTEEMKVLDTALSFRDSNRKKTNVSAKMLHIYNKENRAVFTKNVVADSDDLNIVAERMELDLETITKNKKETKQLKRITCYKNSKGTIEPMPDDKRVVVIRKKLADPETGETQEKSISGKAVYNVKTGEIKLTDKPVIIQDSNTLAGSTITIWRDTEIVNVDDAKLLLDDTIEKNK